jgi:hypothetical protein
MKFILFWQSEMGPVEGSYMRGNQIPAVLGLLATAVQAHDGTGMIHLNGN